MMKKSIETIILQKECKMYLWKRTKEPTKRGERHLCLNPNTKQLYTALHENIEHLRAKNQVT